MAVVLFVVLNMNGFRLSDHTLIFLREPHKVSGSVFAHACIPNARLMLDKIPTGRSGVYFFAWKIKVLKDIPSSEQVTINYRGDESVDLDDVDVRRDRLEKVWGFKCECDLCVEQHAKKSASRGSNQA